MIVKRVSVLINETKFNLVRSDALNVRTLILKKHD